MCERNSLTKLVLFLLRVVKRLVLEYTFKNRKALQYKNPMPIH